VPLSSLYQSDKGKTILLASRGYVFLGEHHHARLFSFALSKEDKHLLATPPHYQIPENIHPTNVP